MGNTNEEKYEYYVSELEKQIGVFETTVEHKDFVSARRLWSELGQGLPIHDFHFAPKGKLSLQGILLYYEKDALRDPVKFGDFVGSCK
jgi:hypothetical protein